MDSAEEQYGIKLERVRDLIENLGVATYSAEERKPVTHG